LKVAIITCALDSAVMREVDRRKYQLTIVDTQYLPSYSDMMNGVECVQPSNSDSLVELSIFESVTSRMIENTGGSTCGIDEVILKRGLALSGVGREVKIFISALSQISNSIDLDKVDCVDVFSNYLLEQDCALSSLSTAKLRVYTQINGAALSLIPLRGRFLMGVRAIKIFFSYVKEQLGFITKMLS